MTLFSVRLGDSQYSFTLTNARIMSHYSEVPPSNMWHWAFVDCPPPLLDAKCHQIPQHQFGQPITPCTTISPLQKLPTKSSFVNDFSTMLSRVLEIALMGKRGFKIVWCFSFSMINFMKKKKIQHFERYKLKLKTCTRQQHVNSQTLQLPKFK